MRDALDALQTTSYRQWAKAITDLREQLDGGAQAEIAELDLLMILRPYLQTSSGFTWDDGSTP